MDPYRSLVHIQQLLSTGDSGRELAELHEILESSDFSDVEQQPVANISPNSVDCRRQALAEAETFLTRAESEKLKLEKLLKSLRASAPKRNRELKRLGLSDTEISNLPQRSTRRRHVPED